MQAPGHHELQRKSKLVAALDLYTSFTNAIACPTDTIPLTPTAKCLTASQSLIALVTVGLVAARAVNILF